MNKPKCTQKKNNIAGRKPLWKAIFLTALIVAMACLALAGAKKGWYEPHFIETSLREMGIFAPLVFMVLMAFSVVTVVLPSIVLDAVAGVVFGPFYGNGVSSSGC